MLKENLESEFKGNINYCLIFLNFEFINFSNDGRFFRMSDLETKTFSGLTPKIYSDTEFVGG
jgi:hypothetical protein